MQKAFNIWKTKFITIYQMSSFVGHTVYNIKP